MKEFFAAIALTSVATAASSATMAFDAIPNSFITEYEENGIKADAGRYQIEELTAGTAHIDSGGTGYARGLIFTMGSRFNAIAFTQIRSTFQYDVYLDGIDVGGTREKIADGYENVLIEGRRGGELVASDRFDMREAATYSFSSAFQNLDNLYIGAASPPDPSVYGFVPDGYFIDVVADAPSAHFNLDSVSLVPVAAVPLPSSVGLLAAGIGLLGFGTRKRKANS